MSSEVILKFRDLISKLEKDVEAVMKLEREEREMAASEAKVTLPSNENQRCRFVFSLFKLYSLNVCVCVVECGPEAT